MPKVLNWKEIVPEKHFKYSAIAQSTSHSGKTVKLSVSTDGSEPCKFIHQTPKLRIPFGLQQSESPNGIRYTADLSFPGVVKDENTDEYIGSDPEILEYFSFLVGVESYNKKLAAQECSKWFKKELSTEVLDTLYHSNIYPVKDELKTKYSPRFKANIMSKSGNPKEFVTSFYNSNSEVITFDDFKSGDNVIALLETTGLWFTGKQFGMSFRVLQLLVFERDEFKGCGINLEAYKDYLNVPKPITDAPEEDEEPASKKPKLTSEGFNLVA